MMQDGGGGSWSISSANRRGHVARVGGDAVFEVADSIGARVAAGQPVRWSPLFEVGVMEIDQDHAQLFDRLNRLADEVVSPGERGVGLTAAMDEFRDAIGSHFEREEGLFQSLSPSLEQVHEEGHRHFNDGVARLAAALTGEDRDAARSALATLAALFVQHILVDDKQLFGAVRGL
jgi:hemerythrin-like metal-binding protein